MEKIGKLLESSPHITLADSNFTRYTADVRPYYSFVVFTALGTQYNCDICKCVHRVGPMFCTE